MRYFRKIVAAFLLVPIFILSLGVSVFAETMVGSGMGNNASSTFAYVVPSTYTIIIPERIDVDSDYTFTAANMNVRDDEMVSVVVNNLEDGYLTFRSSNGNTTFKKKLEATALNEKASNIPPNCVGLFFENDLTSSVSFRASDDTFLASGIVRAGEYTATVEFQIDLTSR